MPNNNHLWVTYATEWSEERSNTSYNSLTLYANMPSTLSLWLVNATKTGLCEWLHLFYIAVAYCKISISNLRFGNYFTLRACGDGTSSRYWAVYYKSFNLCSVGADKVWQTAQTFHLVHNAEQLNCFEIYSRVELTVCRVDSCVELTCVELTFW